MNAKRLAVFITSIILVTAIVGGTHFTFSFNHGLDTFHRTFLGWLPDSQFLNFKEAKIRLPERPEEVSVIAVGDIMPSRGVANRMRAHNDFNYPFLSTRDYLKTADIVFGNLESPITPGRRIQSKEMVFRADPGFVGALREAGFSIVSLANNHTPNFGDKGLLDTFHYLDRAGIKYIGAGPNDLRAYSAVYVESKGVRFAFLAYNDTDVVPEQYGAKSNRPGTAFMDVEKVVSAVRDAKRKANFVIVSMHAGEEYTVKPNQSQIKFAHAAIDAGAELVIGHHPHVVQRGERYKGKYILYSLGNFVFDQMWSKETREGLVAKAFFNKDGVTKIELQPILIEDYAQPRMLDGKQAEGILERLGIPLGERVIFTWNQEKDTFEQKSKKVICNDQADTTYKVSRSQAGNLNGDSQKERYNLRNGRLRVLQGNKITWETSSDWWVDDFVLADSTGDGTTDINLSVWKADNYGTTKPFWVKENDRRIRNYLCVLDFASNQIKLVWQPSNLDRPNRQFLFEDLDGDSREELVTLEGEYADIQHRGDRYIAVWKWKEWGFFNEWRSGAGRFKNLAIEKIGKSVYIVADSSN